MDKSDNGWCYAWKGGDLRGGGPRHIWRMRGSPETTGLITVYDLLSFGRRKTGPLSETSWACALLLNLSGRQKAFELRSWGQTE